MALGPTQPLTEISTRNLSWWGGGLSGRCEWLTTLPPSSAPGALRACSRPVMGELYLYFKRLGEPQSRSGRRRREKSVNPTGILKPDRLHRTMKEPEGLTQCSDHIVGLGRGGAEGLCCVPGKGNRCLYIPELLLALILDFTVK
jgi:hypothetical protein